MNILLPLKMGDVAKGVLIQKQSNIRFTNAFATIVLERVYDIISLGLMMVIPILFFGIEFIFKEDLRLSIIFSFALIAIILGGIILLIFKKDFIIDILIKILKILPLIKEREGLQFEVKNLFDQINISLKDSIQNTKRAIWIFISSGFIWFLEGLTAYFVVFSFGIELDLWLVVSGVVIANFLKAVPATPGGIGFYELGFFLVLSFAGVPEAAVIAVLDHLIKNIVLLIYGGLLTLVYGQKAIEPIIND
jgi:uncharacterized protein (TIRG00374 family)